MGVTVDVAYKSLNKFNEVLCGDKVELLQTEDSNIMILADGMGSGVKANILATLTSKILGTMFLNGATLEECVETIVETLPVCQVRQVAYSTFSILQVFHNGDAYLVEFDNPSCIFIRAGQLVPIPQNIRVIQNKKINEYRFRVKKGDALILMSDGDPRRSRSALKLRLAVGRYCRLCAETVPGHHLRDPSGYSTQPGLRRTVPVPAGR